MDIIKLKRQVRDWFNKNVHDEQTINEVAKIIGYNKEVNHGSLYGSISVLGARQDGHNS